MIINMSAGGICHLLTDVCRCLVYIVSTPLPPRVAFLITHSANISDEVTTKVLIRHRHTKVTIHLDGFHHVDVIPTARCFTRCVLSFGEELTGPRTPVRASGQRHHPDIRSNLTEIVSRVFRRTLLGYRAVSYTHLTLPTTRSV